MARFADPFKRLAYRCYPLVRRFVPDEYRAYACPGGKIYLNLRESKTMFKRVLGLYERDKVRALQTFLRPGGTFVDVGANKGDFSLLAARLTGPEGTVLTVEPEPANCGWIRKSIALNGYRNIRLIEAALGERDGTAALHIAEKSGWHTLLPGKPQRDTRAIEVQQRALDSLLAEAGAKRVDLLKIDVEGFELPVLRGARETLAAQRELVVLVDLHPRLGVNVQEICEFLRGLGYAVCSTRAPYPCLEGVPPRLGEILARRQG